MAEAYLQKGDLWEFLQQVDNELTRVKTVVKDIEEREENWAANFVDKVRKLLCCW